MDEVVTWLLAGLAAGGFASALEPNPTRVARLGVVAAGVAGALLGGWCWTQALGGGPASFLGAAVLGVLGALAARAVRRR